MSNVPSRPMDLSTRRCANHSEREAIARCLKCGGYFCRECVTEHDGKLTCAVCLAKLGQAGKRSAKSFWSMAAGIATFAAGVLVAWVFFYYIGWFLLGLSDSFHT